MDYELSSVEGMLHIKRRNGRTLLERYGTDNEDSALVTAVEENDIDTVQQLLDSGVDVDVRDSAGDTVLHTAARLGHVHLCALLLSHGADINVQNKAEFTPLFLAARVNLRTVRVLLELGAAVDLRNHLGEVPLHAASSSGLIDVIVSLVSSGSDVNARSFRGVTPIYFAIGSGSREAVRTLLRLGAEVNDVITPEPAHPNRDLKRQNTQENLAVGTSNQALPNSGAKSTSVQKTQENLAESKHVRVCVPKQKRLFQRQRSCPEQTSFQSVVQDSTAVHQLHQPTHSRSDNPGQRQSQSRSWLQNDQRQGGSWLPDGRRQGGSWPPNGRRQGGSWPPNGWRQGGSWPTSGQQQSGPWPRNGLCQCGLWLQGHHHAGDRVIPREHHLPHEELQEQRGVVVSEDATSCQRSDSLSLQHPESLSLQHPESLSPQHPESLSLQHPESLSLQHPESLSLQHPDSLSPQHPESLSRQQPESLSHQQPESLFPHSQPLYRPCSESSFQQCQPSCQRSLPLSRRSEPLSSQRSEPSSFHISTSESMIHHSKPLFQIPESSSCQHCEPLFQHTTSHNFVTLSALKKKEKDTEKIPEENASGDSASQRGDSGSEIQQCPGDGVRNLHGRIRMVSTDRPHIRFSTCPMQVCRRKRETLHRGTVTSSSHLAGNEYNQHLPRSVPDPNWSSLYRQPHIQGDDDFPDGADLRFGRLSLPQPTEVAEKLSSQEALPGLTPLHRACQLGMETVAQVLLEAGARVNARTARGETPLHMAAMYSSISGHGEATGLIRILLKVGADIEAVTNVESSTPLHAAALVGDALSTSLLISAGADLHKRDSRGCSPLHKACERVVSPEGNRLRTVRLLLMHGASARAVNEEGLSALHVLLLHKTDDMDHDVVRVLLNHHADPNQPTPAGEAPLLLALQSRMYGFAKVLVEKGADPNVQADDGKTPLHYVCKDGHVSLFKLLWSKGGDPTICDRDGCTPLRYALETGDEVIVGACVCSGASIRGYSCAVASPSLRYVFDNAAKWSSPFFYSFASARFPFLVLLFSFGCFSFRELHTLRDMCLSSNPDQLTSVSQQQVVSFVLRVSQTPPSLQNLCRWKISHLIGCSADRKSRARQLGLPSLLRDFVLFVTGS